MLEFEIERDINCPPAEVFAYVTDATKLATWQTNTVSAVPDGPIALGTKIREVHRAPGGKQIETVVEVVEYEPERAFRLRTIEGLPVDGHITLEPRDGGTRFRFKVYAQPTGMMRIAQPLMRAMLRRQFDQHCTTLKTVLEAPPSR
ncbi:MAG: SRPBCC family protein [Solirubrobacteraceae bacterium]